MNVTYGIIKETYEVGNIKRTSYGIAAFSNVPYNGASCIVFAARDLSAERAPIEELVCKNNRFQLSETHFNDIINDFLTTR